MNTLNKYKNYLLIIFLTILVLQLTFFGLIREHDHLSNQPELVFKWHYIVLFALIFFTFLMFITGWNQVNKKVLAELQSSKKEEQQHHVKAEHKDENVKDKTSKTEGEIKYTQSEIIPSGQNDDIDKYYDKILINISKKIQIAQGLIFLKDKESDVFRLKGKYAFVDEKNTHEFKEGETLPGQVVKDKKSLNIKNLPKDYILVFSGLGETSPQNLLIVPVIRDDKVQAIIELSAFTEFKEHQVNFIEKIAVLLAEKISL